MARSYSNTALQGLTNIIAKSENDSARVAACIHLLDRGWGRCEQPHSGDVSGQIEIIVRHIVEGRDAPRVIDAGPSDGQS